MMNNYDAVAQTLLQTNPPPHNYIVHIVDKNDPGILYLRLYADDINNKPDSYAAALTTWLNAILNQLNSHPLVTTKFTWEMAEKP